MLSGVNSWKLQIASTIPVILDSHPPSRFSRFPSNAFIVMNLPFSAILVLFLGLANALITFENIDTLAVITTSCFKTIGRHESFQTPLLNFQHVIPREEYGQNLEIVSSLICRRKAISKRPKVTANALLELNSNLTVMLDVPMDEAKKVK